MSYIAILLIALALSLDAFTVAVCGGISIRNLKRHHTFRIALCFGGFQALMPILGWWLGLSVSKFVANYDHWVAFGLLLLVGGKMIYESFKNGGCPTNINFMDNHVLLMLGVATSIDAFAVGLTFALLKSGIIIPAMIIGLVTFGVSWLGVVLGERFGGLFKAHIGVVGGLILIGLGSKILYDHLSTY